ncbi:hypothetical protein [Streptomyces sp. NPDC046197]|uniref:hypothetical protein n=1 Tax=Streptomyces sp. NPDC046197 TaxID=3154337 RepID=UPI0033F2647A
MTSTDRSRRARALAAGALSAALLSAGSAGAVAATGTPSPTPTRTHTGMPTMKPTRTPSRTPSMMMGSITAKPNHKAVRVGNTVVITGKVKDLKPGTKLVVQHLKNSKWTTLQASTTVTKNGTYVLKAKLNNKGLEQLRVAAGNVHSPSFNVRVS